MKGKPHPRTYTEAQMRRVLKWLDEAHARAEKTGAENAQLKKELKLAKKAIQEMVAHNRRVEQTWMKGVAKNPMVN